MPHDGRARTGVLGATGTRQADAFDTGSPPPVPEAVTSERALTFVGAALEQRSICPVPGIRSFGWWKPPEAPVASTGCRSVCPLSGDSPAAHAWRAGRPLWLTSEALASYSTGGPAPAAGGVARHTAARDGARIAWAASSSWGIRRTASRPNNAASWSSTPTRSSPCSGRERAGPPRRRYLSPALRSLCVGSFVITPDTGLIEADETLLEFAQHPRR